MGIELLVMFSRHPDIWFPSCHHYSCFHNMISELHQLRAIVTTVETHMNVSSPRSLSKSFLRRWCHLTETPSNEVIENKRLNSTEPNLLNKVSETNSAQLVQTEMLDDKRNNFFFSITTKQWSEGKSRRISMKTEVSSHLWYVLKQSLHSFLTRTTPRQDNWSIPENLPKTQETLIGAEYSLDCNKTKCCRFSNSTDENLKVGVPTRK